MPLKTTLTFGSEATKRKAQLEILIFGIDIPGNFKLWNEYGMLGLKDTAKRRYTNLGDAQAEFCKKCGKCEKLCPQSIQIREDLKQVAQDIKNL